MNLKVWKIDVYSLASLAWNTGELMLFVKRSWIEVMKPFLLKPHFKLISFVDLGYRNKSASEGQWKEGMNWCDPKSGSSLNLEDL